MDSSLHLPTAGTQDPQSIKKPLKVPHGTAPGAQSPSPELPTERKLSCFFPPKGHFSCFSKENFLCPTIPTQQVSSRWPAEPMFLRSPGLRQDPSPCAQGSLPPLPVPVRPILHLIRPLHTVHREVAKVSEQACGEARPAAPGYPWTPQPRPLSRTRHSSEKEQGAGSQSDQAR